MISFLSCLTAGRQTGAPRRAPVAYEAPKNTASRELPKAPDTNRFRKSSTPVCESPLHPGLFLQPATLPPVTSQKSRNPAGVLRQPGSPNRITGGRARPGILRTVSHAARYRAERPPISCSLMGMGCMPTLPAGFRRLFGIIGEISRFMLVAAGAVPGSMAAVAMLPALAAGLGRFFPIPGKGYPDYGWPLHRHDCRPRARGTNDVFRARSWNAPVVQGRAVHHAAHPGRRGPCPSQYADPHIFSKFSFSKTIFLN